MNLPRILVISSDEGLRIASHFRHELRHEADVTLRADLRTGLSVTKLEQLLESGAQADLVVLLASAGDDLSATLVDIGGLVSRIRSNRFVAVLPAGIEKEFMNLTGFRFINYDERRVVDDIAAAIAPVCDSIRQLIRTGGDRAGEHLPRLFVCYRRDDTADAAGRLFERLAHTYGFDRVFMDIDSVPLGIDFVEHVTAQISQCKAVVVLIGRQWLKIKDRSRRRRLDDPDDLVRAEIAAALRQKIPVIPVLVQNASMPTAADLPDDIRLLARRNGIALRHEQWREGVERLLKELNPVMGVKQ